MTTKQFINALINEVEEIRGIQYEDYNGNMIEKIFFREVDVADIEEGFIRLQLNGK